MSNETSASEPMGDPDVGSMLDRIETVLRAIANSPMRLDGESLRWTVKHGYSGLVTASVELFDREDKPIARAVVTANLRVDTGHPDHSQIVRALYAQAMKIARKYAAAFNATVTQ